MFYRADFEIGFVFREEILPVDQTLQKAIFSGQLSRNVTT